MKNTNLHKKCSTQDELHYDPEEMAAKIIKALNGEGHNLEGKFTASQLKAFQGIRNALENK